MHIHKKFECDLKHVIEDDLENASNPMKIMLEKKIGN